MRLLYIDGKTMSTKTRKMHNKKYIKVVKLDKMLSSVAKVLCIHGDFLEIKKKCNKKQIKCCISLNYIFDK